MTKKSAFRIFAVKNVLVGLLGATAIVTLALLLMLKLEPNPPFSRYEAVGELLLVFVLAVEGGIAFFEFSHQQTSSRTAANAAVFELYKIYLSPDYQQKVRRPAWYALSRARKDKAYRRLLISALAGESSGDDIDNDGVYERSRIEGRENASENDRRAWAFHDEYHRVQDILGFFAILSVWTHKSDPNKADPTVVQLCHFFYDRWHVHLHRIVQDLEMHESDDIFANKMKGERVNGYKNTLRQLDVIFGIEKDIWKEHPSGRNSDG